MATVADNVGAVERNYGRSGLVERTLAALNSAGLDPNVLDRDALQPLDEFHIRGRAATRELAALAGLSTGSRVVDVGCGVGGPARTLAAEFGCRVTGVDLMAEYCELAELLTAGTGLSEHVTVRHGSALAMPFVDGAFDAAWMQHVSMNIEDKPCLYRELRRVLRVGGVLALNEVYAGPAGGRRYPVPWAADAGIDFLVSQEEARRTIVAAGLRELRWVDVTVKSTEWFRNVLGARRSGPPPALGLHLLVGDFPTRAANVLRNLEEGRITVAMGVFVKDGGESES